MAWITPKTDWKVTRDTNGNYLGDYFNVEDYNRIKNNMIYIYEMASITPPDLGDDKVCNANAISPIYAREINAFEDAIEYLKSHVADLDTGEPTEYFQNGRAITYEELNRIEGAELKYYNYLST